MKTIVCKLKDNPLGYKSVGIPTDESDIPDWFKALPFDNVTSPVILAFPDTSNFSVGVVVPIPTLPFGIIILL